MWRVYLALLAQRSEPDSVEVQEAVMLEVEGAPYPEPVAVE